MKIRVESGRRPTIDRWSVPDTPIAPGDYFHSERALFRVERCDYGRALVENCRSGELLDVAVEHLTRLHRLER
jgi:hypothetical protein